jgi:hypothetical protein
MPANLAEVWGGALLASPAEAASARRATVAPPPPDEQPLGPAPWPLAARAPPPDPALLLERAVSGLGLVAALLVLLLLQLERTAAQLRRVEAALLRPR